MKGVEPRVMMAQMFAKTTGLSKGRDSALHSGVNELGIFGNTSMLGANLPVAAGVALTMKMEQKDSVCIAYFGEGASNTGDFHEAMNFAGVNKLPIVFICENNLYAYSVPIEKSMAVEDVAVRAEGYGFDGVAINGNDVLAVYQAVKGAAGARARGRGPDADRMQDLSLARPLRARQGVLSHQGRAGDVEEPRSAADVYRLPRAHERADARKGTGDRSAHQGRAGRRRAVRRRQPRSGA